jgi:putative ABC transport system permease protein
MPAVPPMPGPFAAAMMQTRPAPTETKYTIAGIVERDPAGALGGALGLSGLMIPLSKAKAANRMPYQSVTVKVTASQFTQDVEEEIKKQGYGAFSINDALEGAKRAFLILDIVLGLIGSIALAVSSLGIVNTMVMSILERTREIGIMKAIGGSDRDIRRIFLIEASAIGCLGGIAGVALGWAVGRVINVGAHIYIQQQGGTPGNLFSLPPWLIGGAIGFSIAVSLIAGSYPAARAAKLNPIEALRHD